MNLERLAVLTAIAATRGSTPTAEIVRLSRDALGAAGVAVALDSVLHVPQCKYRWRPLVREPA